MSHYTISYRDLDPIEAYAYALNDVREYMGPHRFLKIAKEFRRDQSKRSYIIDCLTMLAGIEGFPAECYADFIIQGYTQNIGVSQ